jgi:hypothetical protein
MWISDYKVRPHSSLVAALVSAKALRADWPKKAVMWPFARGGPPC